MLSMQSLVVIQKADLQRDLGLQRMKTALKDGLGNRCLVRLNKGFHLK
jgi:hypothetical protein